MIRYMVSPVIGKLQTQGTGPHSLPAVGRATVSTQTRAGVNAQSRSTVRAGVDWFVSEEKNTEAPGMLQHTHHVIWESHLRGFIQRDWSQDLKVMLLLL